jgi:hypothetical protein
MNLAYHSEMVGSKEPLPNRSIWKHLPRRVTSIIILSVLLITGLLLAFSSGTGTSKPSDAYTFAVRPLLCFVPSLAQASTKATTQTLPVAGNPCDSSSRVNSQFVDTYFFNGSRENFPTPSDSKFTSTPDTSRASDLANRVVLLSALPKVSPGFRSILGPSELSDASIAMATTRPEPFLKGQYYLQLKLTNAGLAKWMVMERRNFGDIVAIVIRGEIIAEIHMEGEPPGTSIPQGPNVTIALLSRMESQALASILNQPS